MQSSEYQCSLVQCGAAMPGLVQWGDLAHTHQLAHCTTPYTAQPLTLHTLGHCITPYTAHTGILHNPLTSTHWNTATTHYPAHTQSLNTTHYTLKYCTQCTLKNCTIRNTAHTGILHNPVHSAHWNTAQNKPKSSSNNLHTAHNVIWHKCAHSTHWNKAHSSTIFPPCTSSQLDMTVWHGHILESCKKFLLQEQTYILLWKYRCPVV